VEFVGNGLKKQGHLLQILRLLHTIFMILKNQLQRLQFLQ